MPEPRVPLTPDQRRKMGDRLQAARFRKRISLREVAGELGVVVHTVHMWEKGSIPIPESRADLADLLGVPEAKIWREYLTALDGRAALLDQ